MEREREWLKWESIFLRCWMVFAFCLFVCVCVCGWIIMWQISKMMSGVCVYVCEFVDAQL